MARSNLPNLTIEGAELMFKNFSGLEKQYNREGDRNFCLALPEETAKKLAEDGWNVKVLKPRDEDEAPKPYIQVAVSFKYAHKAPKCYSITSRGRNLIPEDLITMFDWAPSLNVDVTVNPSEWEVNGKTGIKAYLKTMYYVIEEDPLDLKYIDVPDSAYGALDAAAEPLQITSGPDGEYVDFTEED